MFSASAVDPELRQAADRYAHLLRISRWALAVVVLAAGDRRSLYARNRRSRRASRPQQGRSGHPVLLIASSVVAILTTVGIVLSLVFEASRFFLHVSPVDFLFGLEWSPQMAMRADQVGAAGSFGAVPLFVGTLLIAFIAMCVAMPVGLISAIYMAEYAHPEVPRGGQAAAGDPRRHPDRRLRLLRRADRGALLSRSRAPIWVSAISSESALAAGVVMGIMIIPFVSSLSDDVITAVPQSMREGSYGLGATQSETIRRVHLAGRAAGHRRRLPAGGSRARSARQ